MNETITEMRITEIGRVMVPVSHQDSAIEFYTGTLGFELRADVPYGGGAVGRGRTARRIDRRRARTRTRGQSDGVRGSIAFTTDDPDTDHAYLRAAGVDTDPEVMRMGGPVPPIVFSAIRTATAC